VDCHNRESALGNSAPQRQSARQWQLIPVFAALVLKNLAVEWRKKADRVGAKRVRKVDRLRLKGARLHQNTYGFVALSRCGHSRSLPMKPCH
jgi:hypothetical protein